MTEDETLQIQGWVRLASGMRDSQDGAGKIAAEPLGDWFVPRQYWSGGSQFLRLTALVTTYVDVVPGSQQLSLGEHADPLATRVALASGEQLVLDPALWIRIGHPGSIALEWEATMPHNAITPKDFEIASFLTRGYHFLRSELSAGLVARLSASVEHYLSEDIREWGLEKLKQMGQYGALRDLPKLDPIFLELLQEPAVAAFLDRTLHRDYVLQTYDALILAPGEGRFPWDFHTDLEVLSGLTFPRERIPAINALYYLGETTQDNGATWIVPCSHRRHDGTPSLEILEQLAIPAEGAAGDILLFDSRLWHCAGNNATNHSRYLIKTLFSEPWIRPAMDYRPNIEVASTMSERTLRLLGCNAAPPTNVADFRRRSDPRRRYRSYEEL